MKTSQQEIMVKSNGYCTPVGVQMQNLTCPGPTPYYNHRYYTLRNGIGSESRAPIKARIFAQTHSSFVERCEIRREFGRVEGERRRLPCRFVL